MSEEKSELCELVAKFLAHHAKETNRFAEQLVEEIRKNEKLTKEIQRVRVGGYPEDLASVVLKLSEIMNFLKIDCVHLYGLRITK